MIPVADPFMADARPSGLQKGRGGFLRAANDTPWVTHPDGVIVNSGPRKGEPLRVPYGQPSKAGTLVENDVGLTKYKQRNTLLGIGMSAELVEQCRDLVGMEAGSDEFRKAADTIVVEADNLTRSWLAADRGSHGHLLCQISDEGVIKLAIPAGVIFDGEALGLDLGTQMAVVRAWIKQLADNGLEILAIEAACVDDLWRLAGTLDRIVRCTRELRFAKPDGEIVVIPAGTVLILDLKFGKIRRAHLIQVASYRQSVPYDTDTEQRGTWPWEISADHALIAHGDFGSDGIPPSFELVWVDVKAGREHGGQCVADAKAWSSRDDLWSVAQIVEGEAPLNRIDEPSPSTPSPQAPEPPAAATPGQAGPVADQPCPAPGRTPDEGDEIADLKFTKLEAHYKALAPAGRAWITSLVTQAQQAGVSFHTHGGHRTARRYRIIRGLVMLANHTPDDDVLRALLVATIVDDAPLHPAKTPGAALGALGAAEASRFTFVVDEFIAA